nr:carbohydrate ABC transporter permease [uncultured Caproiciproducens sp.]
MELSDYLRKPGLPLSLERKQAMKNERSLKLEPVRKVAETAALLLIAAVFIFPFLWMLTTSFKTLPELLVFPPPFLPKNWIPDNYRQVWSAGTFPKYIWNSLVVSLSILILQFIIITPAAYAFARKKFRGSKLMFNLVLVGLMVPEQVTFLPVYLMFSKVGLIDTYAALILPFVFSPFGIFFLTQSIRQIPNEIFEAAWLDQASEFTIMTKIVLPMIRPAIITFGLFSFISHWNDYFWALSMTTSENIRTLSIGVTTLLNNEGLKNWNVLMAGNMIQVIPILILYLTASSKIKSAFTYSGIK